ncbi:MAG: YeeE/YedE family protein [Gammaproteobacteria bacterium]|nr:YeeE/YedE family protein [Gammaproteobacteria bacterium]
MVFTTQELINGALGGALIGIAALILMGGIGRIAGITGITVAAFREKGDRAWRIAFVAGLLASPWLASAMGFEFPTPQIDSSPLLTAIAGVLVGFGAAYGGGCTSGHGICGLSRFSARSTVAVATFMTTAIVTVYLARHVFGA